MIRLRTGYVIVGIITGLLLVLSFFVTIPDGKLHITICDVGQGDGIYIRFPDGKDLVVDGGPNNKIINCLSRHMPFWDRTIDVAILTHPQKDHLNGLLSVLERYHVDYFLRSDVENRTEGFDSLEKLIKQKQIPEKLVTNGETISIGSANISILWPTREQIATMKFSKRSDLVKQGQTLQVLGESTSDSNINDASIVFSLSYGTFDALFMGDADSHIQGKLITSLRPGIIPDGIIELFKVPHHGSKTGMTDAFVSFIRSDPAKQGLTLRKALAVISVGKNSYGHPSSDIIEKLESVGYQVKRTDKEEDIEVVSDGKTWEIKN